MNGDSSVGEEVKQRKLQEQVKEKQQAKRANVQALKNIADEGGSMEQMSHQGTFESTFDNFSEMAIQFGYLALFSPIFPLAPLLAMLNNVVEMRVDATYLCYHIRRPDWIVANDIGTWYTVFSLIGFLAVITNATMVTFVGKQMAQSDAERSGGLSTRVENWHLWGYAIALEHSVMLLRVCILIVTPEAPRWLKSARDELKWHISKMRPMAVLQHIVAEHEEELLEAAATPAKEAAMKDFDHDAELELLLCGRPKDWYDDDGGNNIRKHMETPEWQARAVDDLWSMPNSPKSLSVDNPLVKEDIEKQSMAPGTKLMNPMEDTADGENTEMDRE